MTGTRRLAVTLTAALAVLVVFGALGALGIRVAVGGLVRSEEFRDTAARLIERALRPVIPRAMVHVSASDLHGFLQVELRDVTIRGTRDVAATFVFGEVQIDPSLASLVLPGPYRAEVRASTPAGATLTATVDVPRSAVAGKTQPGDVVAVAGRAERLDGAQLGALLLNENGIPGIKVVQGLVGLTFDFSRAIDDAAAGPARRGHLEWTTEDLTMALAEDEARAVAFPPVRSAFVLVDYVLTLASPLTLPDPAGSATLTGKILLPERADQALTWDLEVELAGAPEFGRALPRIFACQEPPASDHYKVSGPVDGSQCLSL